MKKIIAMCIAIATVLAFLMPAGVADDTTEINMTLTDTAEIIVETTGNNKYWNFTGATGTTHTSNDTYWINNTGAVQVDVTVVATDTAAWTLEVAPGADQFTLMQNETGGWIDIPEGTPAAFKTNFAGSASATFYYQVELPLSATVSTSQQTIVTFAATVD